MSEYPWIDCVIAFVVGIFSGLVLEAARRIAQRYREKRWICVECSQRAYTPSRVEIREGVCKNCDRIRELAT